MNHLWSVLWILFLSKLNKTGRLWGLWMCPDERWDYFDSGFWEPSNIVLVGFSLSVFPLPSDNWATSPRFASGIITTSRDYVPRSWSWVQITLIFFKLTGFKLDSDKTWIKCKRCYKNKEMQHYVSYTYIYLLFYRDFFINRGKKLLDVIY